MTSALGDALAAGIDRPDPAPTSGPALIRYAGGKRALAQQLSGMRGTPRRGDYSDDESFKAARTRWRSAERRVQRWDEGGKQGKQRRGTSTRPVRLEPEQRERVSAAAVDRKWSRLVRFGARCRLWAAVRVPSPTARRAAKDERWKQMPAPPGPGVLIPAEAVSEILAEVESDPDRAAGLWLEAFWDAYGMPDDAEIEEVGWLKMWVDGDAEPAG